jgi:hypothetical protein
MKATDHELQKYDNFTRYGQLARAGSDCRLAPYSIPKACM